MRQSLWMTSTGNLTGAPLNGGRSIRDGSIIWDLDAAIERSAPNWHLYWCAEWPRSNVVSNQICVKEHELRSHEGVCCPTHCLLPATAAPLGSLMRLVLAAANIYTCVYTNTYTYINTWVYTNTHTHVDTYINTFTPMWPHIWSKNVSDKKWWARLSIFLKNHHALLFMLYRSRDLSEISDRSLTITFSLIFRLIIPADFSRL